MFSGQVEFERSERISPPDARTDARRNSAGFAVEVSDRLHIRLLELTDAEALFAVVDANRAYLKQWLSWLNTTQTLDDTRHFIRQTQARVQDRQGFAAAMVYDGNIAGVIGLNGINWCDRQSSIGYWLAQNQQGQGLVTTACQAILHHAFTHLELNRIAIICATGNHRSQAIPQRLGFTHEGKLREAQWLYDHYVDHEIYALLHRHWQKS